MSKHGLSLELTNSLGYEQSSAFCGSGVGFGRLLPRDDGWEVGLQTGLLLWNLNSITLIGIYSK